MDENDCKIVLWGNHIYWTNCSQVEIEHTNLRQTDFQGSFRKHKDTSNAAIQLISTKTRKVRHFDAEFKILI